jgi:hypothetical protein
MQQHLIDHTEHRGAGADSERQRGHCNHGKPGAPAKLARRVTKVLK